MNNVYIYIWEMFYTNKCVVVHCVQPLLSELLFQSPQLARDNGDNAAINGQTGEIQNSGGDC